MLLHRWSGGGSLYPLFIPHHKWGPVNVNNRKAADHDERAARIVVWNTHAETAQHLPINSDKDRIFHYWISGLNGAKIIL